MSDKTPDQIFHVGSIMKPIGWFIAGLFGIAAAWSHHDGAAALTSLGLVGAAVAGICMALLSPRIEISGRSLVEQQFEARYRINWDEITRATVNQYGFIFHGKDKAFVLPTPAYWTGPDKKQALELIEAQLKARNISMEENLTAGYSHKNVRVSKTDETKTV